LIVDDEPMIRHTINEALRELEYDTVEAGTVAGALTSFEAERPAAVLLDINLPDGSRLDALREIKKRWPQAVVVMPAWRRLRLHQQAGQLPLAGEERLNTLR
jgi:DNA-binding response OmpR family regulator